MNRKLSAIGTSLLATSLLFTGCGIATDTPDAPDVIDYWLWDSAQQPGYQQSYQYDDSDIVYPDGRRGAPRGAPLAGDMRAPQPYQTQPYAQRRVYPQPYYQQDQGYYVQPQQQPYYQQQPYQPRYYNSY